MGANIALQGEIAGPGIAKNRANLSDVRLFIFTGIDLDNESRRLSPDELRGLVGDLNDCYLGQYERIQLVPNIGVVKAGTITTMEQLEEFVDGLGINETVREGLVFRGVNDSNISFKFVSPKYLLKHKE